jgi:hypothetical protein
MIRLWLIGTMQIKSKCAWCEITNINEKNVSHGICQKCAEKFKKEIINGDYQASSAKFTSK